MAPEYAHHLTPSHGNEIMQINSIYSRLTSAERSLRDEVMARMISQHKPVDVDSLTGSDSLKKETVTSLINKKVLVIGQNGSIDFSYPVSALPSSHQVTLNDGRWFYAMCAVDALGCAFTFRQNTKISSKCHYCKEPIDVQIVEGEIASLDPPESHVLHVDLSKFDDWSANC